MKELYSEIGFLLLMVFTSCLAMPTVLENSGNLEENSQVPAAAESITETVALLQSSKELVNPTETKPAVGVQTLEQQSLHTPADFRETIEIVEKPAEILKESSRNLEVKDETEKSPEKIADLVAENNKKEEDFKLKDSPKDVEQTEIDKQSEVWKDFENDFSLLEERLPDLTAEEYHEINKDGAMPWNFLKSFDNRREINGVTPKPIQAVAPIYITVPIVINTHSGMPITLSIGGQNVPLNSEGIAVKKPAEKITATVKQPADNTTPTSIYNRLVDYDKPFIPHRPTNRHRSNFRKKIYARNNGHVVEAYEY